jgi:hypothetical protein
MKKIQFLSLLILVLSLITSAFLASCKSKRAKSYYRLEAIRIFPIKYAGIDSNGCILITETNTVRNSVQVGMCIKLDVDYYIDGGFMESIFGDIELGIFGSKEQIRELTIWVESEDNKDSIDISGFLKGDSLIQSFLWVDGRWLLNPRELDKTRCFIVTPYDNIANVKREFNINGPSSLGGKAIEHELLFWMDKSGISSLDAPYRYYMKIILSNDEVITGKSDVVTF